MKSSLRLVLCAVLIVGVRSASHAQHFDWAVAVGSAELSGAFEREVHSFAMRSTVAKRTRLASCGWVGLAASNHL